MSFQDISAEKLAELFHHYHRALGSNFGCTGKTIRAAWEEVPQPEKNRLVTAARLTLLELDNTHVDHEGPRRYFATPGEAEWGC